MGIKKYKKQEYKNTKRSTKIQKGNTKIEKGKYKTTKRKTKKQKGTQKYKKEYKKGNTKEGIQNKHGIQNKKEYKIKVIKIQKSGNAPVYLECTGAIKQRMRSSRSSSSSVRTDSMSDKKSINSRCSSSPLGTT